MVSPVVNPDLSDANRTTKAEISSGNPIRPTGIISFISYGIVKTIGVVIVPGAMQLTVIP
jgi:hypothetical protein